MSFQKPKRIENRALLDTYHTKRCAACGKSPPSDPSHIISRGAGGPDEPWNLMPLCRVHHTQLHQIGCVTFTRLYPGYWLSLQMKGWQVIDGKLRHPMMSKV